MSLLTPTEDTADVRYAGIDALLLAQTGPAAVATSLAGRRRLTELSKDLAASLESGAVADACQNAHFRTALAHTSRLSVDAQRLGLILVSDRIAAVKRRIEAANFQAAKLASLEALKSMERTRDEVACHSRRFEAKRLRQGR